MMTPGRGVWNANLGAFNNYSVGTCKLTQA